jgi:hypothetical protein
VAVLVGVLRERHQCSFMRSLIVSVVTGCVDVNIGVPHQQSNICLISNYIRPDHLINLIEMNLSITGLGCTL